MTILKCTYCGQTNDHTDSRGGCPGCGSPLPMPILVDVEDGVLPFLDLSFNGGHNEVNPCSHICMYEVDTRIGGKCSYDYQVPFSRVLDTITFICTQAEKIGALRYTITADGCMRVLDIMHLAIVTKVPMQMDVRNFHSVMVGIENLTLVPLDVQFLLRTTL